jgi:hypothetical protein
MLTNRDIFGFIRPKIDVHSLGISVVSKLLRDCGFKVLISDAIISSAVENISKLNSSDIFVRWLIENNISCLGFSYRLDPAQAQIFFGKMIYHLQEKKMFNEQGGHIKEIYFAGLPESCQRISSEYKDKVKVFFGDETPAETLEKIGVPQSLIPKQVLGDTAYDRMRMDFAKSIIENEEYHFEKAANRSGYKNFGLKTDTITERIEYVRKTNQHPIIRAHVGPYLPKREDAVLSFIDWSKQLASANFLDVLSIGTSQLTQSNFGEDWKDKSNGGGVPINSASEYHEVWKASRPMLVRTYAGTKNIPYLAKIHEESLNICWHALSLWWFCKIDGRGEYSVKENLIQHFETLKFIAKTNKPFEPNIPHHFSFRGGDDVTYIVSAYLAVKAAKIMGIKSVIVQNMLNTPKYTWGTKDLAKSRAMLRLIKSLESTDFKIYWQTRAGLDYFSPDLIKAKLQLASVTALMDDIDPNNNYSPDIIHVVSYSEANSLATPQIINESIKITINALKNYREKRSKGLIENMAYNTDTNLYAQELFDESLQTIKTIETNIPNAYSPEGFYKIFAAGFLVSPYLWECQEEFKNAIKWQTEIIDGSVRIVDESGKQIKSAERLNIQLEDLNKLQ